MLSNILPFLLLIFFFFLCAFIDIGQIKIKNIPKKGIVSILWICLALFAGCRWSSAKLIELGVFDYGAYKYVYEEALDISNFWNEYLISDNYFKGMDLGYLFISSFFSKHIISSPNLFFLLISCVTVYLLYKGFVRNRIHTLLLFLLFIYLTRLYFQYNFIIMRQALAMAMVWYAIPWIIERKPGRFIAICFVAASIHFSAIFFLLAYLFPKINFTSKFILCTFSLLFLLVITGLTNSLIQIVMHSAVNLLGLSSRLIFYLNSGAYSRGINLLNFVEILPFLYLAMKYRHRLVGNIYGRFFFNMFIFYVLFLLITMNFSALTRISSYFIYSYFFILSATWKFIYLKTNKIIIGSVLAVYFLIYGIRFAFANFYEIPYNMFLFHI